MQLSDKLIDLEAKEKAIPDGEFRRKCSILYDHPRLRNTAQIALVLILDFKIYAPFLSF